MASRSIDIRHEYVLSVELVTPEEGKPHLEVMTLLPLDPDKPEFKSMEAAVNEQRDNLPPWKHGSHVKYVNPKYVGSGMF